MARQVSPEPARVDWGHENGRAAIVENIAAIRVGISVAIWRLPQAFVRRFRRCQQVRRIPLDNGAVRTKKAAHDPLDLLDGSFVQPR